MVDPTSPMWSGNCARSSPEVQRFAKSANVVTFPSGDAVGPEARPARMPSTYFRAPGSLSVGSSAMALTVRAIHSDRLAVCSMATSSEPSSARAFASSRLVAAGHATPLRLPFATATSA
ncbi:MAG: hypothetical protein HYV09_35825 [Deltaproteobacteria bacterium]|nr:hypothetical protein [Deltaproteobacteria bacterium]